MFTIKPLKHSALFKSWIIISSDGPKIGVMFLLTSKFHLGWMLPHMIFDSKPLQLS